MTYKTIVAVLPDKDAAKRVLSVAVPLAQRNKSHLIAVHAEPSPAAYATPIGFPEAGLLEATAEENEARAEALKEYYDSTLSAEGLSFEWRGMQSFVGDSAVSALPSARCADLVITAQPDPGSANARMTDNEALLFDSGRPVLFIPYAAAIPQQYDRVLVAWNGSKEAARAVFDAMPFIMAAREVEIFSVDPKSNAEQSAPTAGAEIATTLARHGANVRVETQISDGVPAASIIENRLSDIQADLLVMGAYSRSRISERLFGGVTRTVLESMPTITLMSR